MHGENISSVEVESVLLRHPAVQEVVIVGFPHERWGEAPHGVIFVKELPKTATGKIQKYILRAQRPAIAPQ